MTYKLNPEIAKIVSPVILIFPDESRCMYSSGKEVTEAVFDEKYRIKTIRAKDDAVEIELMKSEPMRSSWIGEEQTFF